MWCALHNTPRSLHARMLVPDTPLKTHKFSAFTACRSDSCDNPCCDSCVSFAESTDALWPSQRLWTPQPFPIRNYTSQTTINNLAWVFFFFSYPLGFLIFDATLRVFNHTYSSGLLDLFCIKKKKGTIYITFIKSFSIIKYSITLLQKFEIPATIQDKTPIRVHKVHSFISFFF